ncbi:hypothetical protein AUQ43_08850 [Thalassospira sp. MCCC 1A01148]|uniref:Glycosyltransferase subfamily 4-like N-terminal domain-containing protein n=2 Tax=Thalassospiraceae TaxID=2844866 RepID=A0A367VJN1_9PROT|nr:hypothetical protein AUQ43_08850 [Thalassospira sp. MCCC 1A01148]RCK25414.1 hypothetical protein TH6_02005 [Thalassospira profundimaris]
MKKKALVFLDFDMLIRHFILSGAFNELEEKYDVKYVFHTDDSSKKLGINFDLEKLGLKSWCRFQVSRYRMGMWDHLFCPTVLHNLRGTDYYVDRLELFKSMRPASLVRKHAFLSLPIIFGVFAFLYKRYMGVHKDLLSFVEEEKADIVIHPSILTGYFINELGPICKRLKIPYVCLMNSWDNPSQKSSATGPADRLVVWGEQTKRHAMEYMRVPEGRVLVFGAAQFQIYRKPVVENDCELRQLFGVPAGLPILLYGGTSKSVEETRHLKIIDDAITRGDIPRCHVVYRPHPWRSGLMENEPDFFECGFENVTMDPHMEAYYRRISKEPDDSFDMAPYEPTRKLLELVSGVVSPLSTILLEAVLCKKPVQVLMTSENVDEEIRRVYEATARQRHFSEFSGPGVGRCTTTTKLVDACCQVLEDSKDDNVKKSLGALGEYFVCQDGATYGERLLSLADELTSGKRA